jgi:hypothetical protein
MLASMPPYSQTYMAYRYRERLEAAGLDSIISTVKVPVLSQVEASHVNAAGNVATSKNFDLAEFARDCICNESEDPENCVRDCVHLSIHKQLHGDDFQRASDRGHSIDPQYRFMRPPTIPLKANGGKSDVLAVPSPGEDKGKEIKSPHQQT